MEEGEIDPKTLGNNLIKMRKKMGELARRLEFERAAELRDRIRELESWAVAQGVAF